MIINIQDDILKLNSINVLDRLLVEENNYSIIIRGELK